MKHIRSLLFFLAAVFLVIGFTSNAAAQKVDDYDIALADVDTATFSDSTDMSVWLLHPDTAAQTAGDTVVAIGGDADSIMIFKFIIFNDSTNSVYDDTLKTVRFTSDNDSTNHFSRIALYREGVGTPLAETTSPGEFETGVEIAFSGLGDIIAAGDSAVYYFEVDVNSAEVNADYDALYSGLRITGEDIVMGLAGIAPNAADNLVYQWDTPTGSEGRPYFFDTKPPDLVIEFDWIADEGEGGGPCVNNNIINLGDSIIIYAWDSTGEYEIDYAWGFFEVFGGGADSVQFDTITVSGSDSAAFFEWRIPDTTFTGSDEISAGFYNLIIGAIDAQGNIIVDTLIPPVDIDTRDPIFDGDSVWVDLYYDANGDGIAAIGDTVSINAWMTGNPIGEIDTVFADLTNWGYGNVGLPDESGDRKYIRLLELTAGALDMDAGDSASLFWVTAYDNACNRIVDTNLANFAIDNEPPAAPTITYERQYDWDTNNKINIGDSIKVTVDASGTSDLDTLCEVSVDLLTSGLGGIQIQCIEDTTAGGVYTYTHLVTDGGIYSVDVGAGVHDVEVTLTDDAGNMEDFTSPDMIYPVDTDPPTAVANLAASRGACAIDLDWDAVSADDSLYLIFWDDGDGWDAADTGRDADGNLIFLDTLGSIDAGTATDWTTDGTVTLTHGTTYQFVVRTIDDANNREYNFNRVSEIADCQAPVACVTDPASGGAYGTNNNLSIIAESDDADIDGVSVYVRDADLGSGTPGPWIAIGSTSQPGGGGVFTQTIDSMDMADEFGCVDDSYELITVAVDEVGNAQTIADAVDTCGLFSFDWFCIALPLELIAVNDTVSPQTSCGYNVTRDANNTVEINVPGHTSGETYTVESWVIYDTDSARVTYETDVAAMPHTFTLDATEFPQGTQFMRIAVVRNDGNFNTITTDLCVPDEDAPMATIVRPADGQIVRQSCTILAPVEVWARINYDSYDFTNTTKVEFYDASYVEGEAPVWTTPYAVVTSMNSGDSTWRAEWDNCAYEDGDVVALAAVFYDDEGNTYETPFVKATIDATMPDITLSVPDALTICDEATLNGSVDLVATVNTTEEDIDSIVFFYALADSPDIFPFYDRIGVGSPATAEGIYKYNNFSTSSLIEGRWYRFRAIAYDIAGNVMYDADGDGLFDDNQFDAVNNTSDALYMIDNTPVQGAISKVVAMDGEEVKWDFQTPSTLLGGAGEAYAVLGNDITVWTWPVPMGDTCCENFVTYYWDGNALGTSDGPMPFEVTFNPVDLGLVDPNMADDYISGTLTMEYTDCFGQTSLDSIDMYLLDPTANDLVFSGPYNGDCVGGDDVGLTVLAVNAFDIDKVEYFWRPAGETAWNKISESTDSGDDFEVSWNTIGLDDGEYELGAISTDASGNQSDPAVITVTVSNTAPTAQLTGPADMAVINDLQVFSAEVLTGTVTQMTFQYKPQTGSSWSTIGTDNFAPWESEWDIGMLSDGYYHIRVWAQNCAGMGSYSDWITVWLDRTNPRAVITDVNGMDVENANDPYLDLTDYDEATVTASFFDDQFNAGNSGISKVAFYLLDSATANVVRVLFVDPADAGSHSATFDISGLTEGTAYYFVARAFDNAGNWADSGPVYWRKFDTTAPIVAIAGYMSGTLYAVDWSGDATSVLFERQDGDEWVGIGIGTEQGSTGIWMADWVPEAGQEYTLRVISGDGDGNYDDENVLTAEFTMDEDGIVSFGTNGLSALVKKNNSSDNIDGILRAVSPNGAPVVLAVYSDAGPELISVDQNQQDETMFHGSFDASGNIYPYGTAMFFVSHPNTAFDAIEIDYTAIVAHEIHPDFGTNGYVQALDSMVQLNVMGDAVNYMWSAIIMESWIPEAGIYQDHFRVVPNPNGNAWYIGCDDDFDKAAENGDKVNPDQLAQNGGYCCFNDNVPGIIRLPYDPDEESEPGDMAVAWWDPVDNEWRFDGILFPAYVEGFNTEDNYVEFATECLYGLYAVVSYRDLPQGPVTIDLLGKSYCGYYPTIPEFKLSVVDRFSEIDTDSWNIWVDDMYLVEQGDEADFIDIDFDEVSNLLFITYEDDYDGPNVDLDPLTCGAHTLTVGVKNNQGAYTEETFDIMVDCAPPQVVFDNQYVSKNPTIEFWVTDEMSGVDTSSIFVDVLAVQTSDTNVFNPNQYEQLFFLQTFFPGQITIGEDGYVSLPTTFELEDERAIVVVIYDGYRTDDYNGADPVAYDDWDEYYHEDHGVHDCVGNPQTPFVQILAIDVDAPSLVMVGENQLPAALNGCVKLRVMDDGGGIEADDITIYEDGLPIERVAPGEEEEGVYSYNENTGIIHYCVTPGVDIDIVLEDGAGNATTFSFGTGDPNVIVDASLTYNPWDPTDDGVLTISYDFTGSSEVKIYDFGGDLVWSRMSSNGSVTWNGNTMDGTRVAKGVYFAHIIANASEGTYSTVVKIAIVDK